MPRSKSANLKKNSNPYDAGQQPNVDKSTAAGRSQTQSDTEQYPNHDGAPKPVIDDTPVTVKGVSEMAKAESRGIHEDINHLVSGEIRGTVCSNLHGLDELKLPNNAIKFNPVAVFNSIENSGTLYKGGRWTDLPTASTPTSEREGHLERLFNQLGDAVAKYKKGRCPRRKWSARFSSAHDVHCKREPDVALMNTEFADLSESVYWTRIFVVTEFKAGTTVSMVDVIQQLAHTARLMFGTQQDRRFVLGIALLNDTMSLVVFNRGGVLMSDTFNVHKSPVRFVRIVAGMQFVDRVHLGFDPNIRLTEIDGRIGRYVEINRKRYQVEDVIHVESVILGRATVCLKVKRGGHTYVVKNSWVDISRDPKEADIMKTLKGIKGLPEMISFEYPQTNDKKEDLTTLDIDELEAREKISKETAAACRMKLDIRQQLRVVLSPFASPLRGFGSIRELLHAVIGVVDAIEALNEKEILHRDLSLRNILLNDEENEDGERDGLLIDLDYAINDAKRSKAAACHRTGTYPFMAIELLDTSVKVTHKYYHDLESVFYVLCYICCTSAGPHGARRKDFKVSKSPLQHWFPPKGGDRGMQGTSYNKFGMVKGEDEFRDNILRSLAPYFNQEAIRICLDRLRELLFPIPLKQDVRAMYIFLKGEVPVLSLPRHEREPKDFCEEFRKILRTAYDAVIEPGAVPPVAAPPGHNDSNSSTAEDELDWRLLDAQENGASQAMDEDEDRLTAGVPEQAPAIQAGSATLVGSKRKTIYLYGEIDPNSPLAKRAKSTRTMVAIQSDSRVLEFMNKGSSRGDRTLLNAPGARNLTNEASQPGTPTAPEPESSQRLTRSKTRALKQKDDLRKAQSFSSLRN